MKFIQKLSVFLLGLSLLISLNQVLAVENPSPGDQPGSSSQNQPANIQTQTRNQVINNVCKNLEEKIAQKINRFESNKDKHLRAYKNLVSRLSKFVVRLEERGFDTQKLAADISAVETKIQKAEGDYTAFINKLKESQSYACGKSQGEFAKRLAESRKLLKTFRDDTAEIRNYFVNIIRKDLMDLHQQIRNRIRTREGMTSASPSPTATETIMP
jgi:hypothetical protein